MNIKIASHGNDISRVIINDSKTYNAKIKFINEIKDVALLEIIDYSAKKWIPLSLHDTNRTGEKIISIGNPSLGDSGIAVNSLNEGIVSKPFKTDSNTNLERIVADITIASGSSGGPLISMDTGKIIGVVTSVIAPTVSKDFATSGYRALSAPSLMFNQWLGLTYEE